MHVCICAHEEYVIVTTLANANKSYVHFYQYLWNLPMNFIYFYLAESAKAESSHQLVKSLRRVRIYNDEDEVYIGERPWNVRKCKD